ncbi:zygote arrest protein 1 isoform X2 [Castor canadensis]|uniref:Zygote arrest protein 1 isoform X2 n=1 Tax=Castor canadensis TaxID=51338 RepID=A0AC58K0H9_CASCN
MAALGDEVLDAYMYPACAPYSYPFPYPPAAKAKGAAVGDGWWLRGGGYPAAASPLSSSATGAASPSFPGCAPLTAAENLDSYRRAQLVALLSQVSPGVGRLPRRTSNRDVAVQVNPRRDAAVQCSLGRRTLQRRPRDPSPPAGRVPSAEGAAGGGSASPQPDSPAAGAPRPVRFPRTVAVYSPVVSRRLTAFLEDEPRPGTPEGERGPRPARPPSPEEGQEAAEKASRQPRSEEDEWEQPTDGPGLSPREARDGGVAPQPAPRSRQQLPAAGRPEDGGDGGDRGDGAEAAAALEGSSPRSVTPGKERLRFQVYFKQFCRTCQKSYNPYRVEDITCQSCKRTRCSCPVRLRHVDPKRPHRQDLCGRCKGKRLSCDSTFSFKYII